MSTKTPPSPGRVPSTSRRDTDPETLDELLVSSRRMGRFWPAAGPQEQAAPVVFGGVRVPAGARRVVAGMPEYGSQ